MLNKRTIEEAQHHCCPLLISPVSLANHDAINVRFLLRTSKCDSEFEGGETKSHGEELQAVCGYHAADRKHAPRLREAALCLLWTAGGPEGRRGFPGRRPTSASSADRGQPCSAGRRFSAGSHSPGPTAPPRPRGKRWTDQQRRIRQQT